MWSSGGDATTQARHAWTLQICQVVGSKTPKTPQVIRLLKKKKAGQNFEEEDPSFQMKFPVTTFAKFSKVFLKIFQILSSLTGPPTSQIENDGVNIAKKKRWISSIWRPWGWCIKSKPSRYIKRALKQALYKGWCGDVYNICLPDSVTDDFRTSQSVLIEICNEKMQNTVIWLLMNFPFSGDMPFRNMFQVSSEVVLLNYFISDALCTIKVPGKDDQRACDLAEEMPLLKPATVWPWHGGGTALRTLKLMTWVSLSMQ